MPQTNELIRAGKVSVFFLDERQSVRPDEIGNVSEIEQAAEEEGVPHVRVDLNIQFRCNGSSEYVHWVPNAMVGTIGVAENGGETISSTRTIVFGHSGARSAPKSVGNPWE